MSEVLRRIQPALAYAATHLDGDVSLAALARRTRLSPYEFHRLFREATGETPKQLTLRLRLGRAAVLLLLSDASVFDIALSCGFQSHEVFCRAFRRRFEAAPRDYRERGFFDSTTPDQAEEHARTVATIGPCVGLYRINEKRRLGADPMSYTVTNTQLAPLPVIVGRKRVKRSDIAATIGQTLMHVFKFAGQRGIALTGYPFTRYVEFGPGLVTMEPGMRIATPGQDTVRIDPSWTVATGEAEVRADTLPGGSAAVTIHVGPYDKLQEAYAAIEEWMVANGISPAGPPWESYLTDPAEYPNPADWKTEVFWPIQEPSRGRD